MEQKELQIADKNIQLSEKIEYLMASGHLLVLQTATGKIRFIYSMSKMNIIEVVSNTRMIDFVNMIVDKYGLYPLIQKYHLNKENGTATTIQKNLLQNKVSQ